jgi:hypothetical protein
MAYLTLYLEDYMEGFYQECPELRPEKPEAGPSMDAYSEIDGEKSAEEESK